MRSTSNRIGRLVPGLYEDINGNIVVLVNKINSDDTMQGMVVHSNISKYKIGDYYGDLALLKPYIGEIILSN